VKFESFELREFLLPCVALNSHITELNK